MKNKLDFLLHLPQSITLRALILILTYMTYFSIILTLFTLDMVIYVYI